MNECDKYQLSLYIDDNLNFLESRRVSEHLLQCSDCRTYFEELKNIKSTLKNLKEIELPKGFHEETMVRIREHKKQPVDFVTNRLKNISDKKLRPVPKMQFWGQLSTVAAGLLLTLVLFGGLGSLLQEPTNSMVGFDDVYSGAVVYDSPETPVATSVILPETTISSAADAIEMEDAEWFVQGRIEAFELADEVNVERQVAYPSMSAFSVPFEEQILEDAGAVMLSGGSSAERAIKHYNISIDVEDFDAAVALIGFMPGYNTGSNMHDYGDSSFRSYDVTRRVEIREYEWLKSELRALGKVTSDIESAQMVYADMIDIEARIRAKEVEQERLFELLERSESVSAMVQITRQLESSGNALDHLRSQKLRYEYGVEGATVHINISHYDMTPQYKTIESFGERLSASFVLSLNMTFGFIEGAAVFISAIGFPLFLLCLVVFVIYLVRNVIIRRRNGNE